MVHGVAAWSMEHGAWSVGYRSHKAPHAQSEGMLSVRTRTPLPPKPPNRQILKPCNRDFGLAAAWVGGLQLRLCCHTSRRETATRSELQPAWNLAARKLQPEKVTV